MHHCTVQRKEDYQVCNNVLQHNKNQQFWTWTMYSSLKKAVHKVSFCYWSPRYLKISVVAPLLHLLHLPCKLSKQSNKTPKSDMGF